MNELIEVVALVERVIPNVGALVPGETMSLNPDLAAQLSDQGIVEIKKAAPARKLKAVGPADTSTDSAEV
jgi:hypothetical protein